MSNEANPPQIKNIDGSYSKDALRSYGITEELARRPIHFETEAAIYDGDFADALDDRRCPVGKMVFEAHTKSGQEGTRRAILGIQMLGVDLGISEQDLEEKKRIYFTNP